jgi:photosystem II stability/assembly factor-like uncharacterized protein
MIQRKKILGRDAKRKVKIMTKLFIALERALVIVEQQGDAWYVDEQLAGMRTQCLSSDPQRPELVYCGTFGEGLWRSKDAGRSWEQVGASVIQPQVMSVAVSQTERIGDVGVVYAGTEPSALYRSEDGGTTWREMETLRQLPSAPTWSFPPRPYTSHIRWITPDPLVHGRLFVAVEAGALLRSLDGGATWEDRKPTGPFDTHTLVMHPAAPERLYSAAGDGFMSPGSGFVQSDDGGQTWYRPDEGLQHHYLWSVAATPADPSTLVISAAPGPQEAHDPAHANSALYRRSGDGSWQLLQDGLPAQQGTLAPILAVTEAEPHTFYMACNHGVFRSPDAGKSWERLPINWPAELPSSRPQALMVL